MSNAPSTPESTAEPRWARARVAWVLIATAALAALDLAAPVAPAWVVATGRALGFLCIAGLAWSVLRGARERAGPLPRDAQRDLRRSESHLRAILDHTVEAILTTDASGVIETFNRAAERMFGWTHAEVVGTNVSMLMPSPHREAHGGYMSAYVRGGPAHVIGIGREVLGQRRDGSTFPLRLSVSEMWIEDERKFAGILSDLTEQKRLEERFVQAQKLEAVGRLATGVAHDFNNLLMGVMSCAELARRAAGADGDAEVLALLHEIRGAAERGAALSRQLTTHSRQKPAETRPMLLDDTIRTVERLLRQALGEDVRVEVELGAGGGPVLADPVKIEQVVMNLAVNARDAMPGGGRLRIATREERLERPLRARNRDLPPGAYVVLEVGDTGSGMTAAVQARVFEPFFTTKAPGRGTGLGLYTVYGIAQELGAGIDFESRLGAGTTFRLYLPRRAPTAVPPPERAAPVPEDAGNGETILLVEDERLIRSTLELALRRLGYRVLSAGDAESALAVAAKHAGRIDLLLSDLVMPGRSGAELARDLALRRPGLRSLLMSAHVHDVLVEQGRIEPGTPTLEKPFGDQDLAAAVRRALLGEHAAQAAGAT